MAWNCEVQRWWKAHLGKYFLSLFCIYIASLICFCSNTYRSLIKICIKSLRIFFCYKICRLPVKFKFFWKCLTIETFFVWIFNSFVHNIYKIATFFYNFKYIADKFLISFPTTLQLYYPIVSHERHISVSRTETFSLHECTVLFICAAFTLGFAFRYILNFFLPCIFHEFTLVGRRLSKKLMFLSFAFPQNNLSIWRTFACCCFSQFEFNSSHCPEIII